MYASTGVRAFEFVTREIRTLGDSRLYLPLHLPQRNASAPAPAWRDAALEGTTRIGVVWHLPEVLREFGVELHDALDDADVPPDIFSDPDNSIGLVPFRRLLATCASLTRCAHFALLVGQRTRLADFGLVGRAARCGATAGEGLQKFVAYFNLHISATTVRLIDAGRFARVVYVLTARDISTASQQQQLAAMAILCNILQDLCGRQWLPTVVTFSTRAPSDLRPIQQFFRVPLRFDSDESAVIFERHWLDRALPPLDPAFRAQVDSEMRDRQAAMLEDFPATVRRAVRKQIVTGKAGMREVAAMFGMHRRTLDRRLQEHGVHYGKLVESVEEQIARQLLRDTRLHVQQIAESLHFSSAANFATAFRRWTGLTPSDFRRGAG
jgi:AraC-like DNA-binding protein